MRTQVGFKCVRLEGSMSVDVRERMIGAFTNDPDVKVGPLQARAAHITVLHRAGMPCPEGCIRT